MADSSLYGMGTMRSVAREIIETLILALLIFLTVRSLVQNFRVEGSSMEPNLHTDEYLMVNKAVYFRLDLPWLSKALPFLGAQTGDDFYLFHAPQRGEVIVFRYPQDPSRDFIKRVIATPGETVEIRSGRIFINGIPFEEPYITDLPRYTMPPQVVPPQNYFVLGDNRNNSSDSHVWGMVPADNIVGQAWFTYWPMGQWGFAPNYIPLAAKNGT